MTKKSKPNKIVPISLLSLIALLLVSVSIINAQSTDSVAYLPIAVGGQESEPLSGSERIEAAGEFALLPEQEPAPTSDEVTETTSEVESSGPLQSITCTTQEWGASDVRALTDRLAFGTDVGIIYPGALIQGGSFQNGTFTPITIPRAGGTITMEGVTLLPGSSYSRSIEEISPESVQDNIKNILESYDPEGGTTANYGDDFQQTYSYEHMLFTLGVDARYGIGSMEADLSIDTEKATNYVFYKFQQKFYDVVYTAPESAVSVFRDGENFVEPDPLSPQIRPGSPPLYVHKVSYGRIVYFVAESQYSSTDIEATLRAAVDGKAFSGGLESGLSYQEVMDETRITTFVLGGNAGDAVQNVKAGSAEERFVAISNFVGSYENANFSAQNPAAAISYELRYLKNRATAEMSYTTVFDRKDCTSELLFPDPEPEDRQMWVRFTNVDDTASLYYVQGNEEILLHEFKCSGSDACNDDHYESIHEFLVGRGRDLDDTHVFKLELDTGGGDGSVNLNYYSAPASAISPPANPTGTKSSTCDGSFFDPCPDREWYYDVNVNAGTWRNQ